MSQMNRDSKIWKKALEKQTLMVEKLCEKISNDSTFGDMTKLRLDLEMPKWYNKKHI